MLKLRISLVLLFVILFSAVADAGVVQIVSSSPKKFIQGNYSMNELPLDIYYDKWLPDDINGSNINDRVKVYGRSEGNFQQLNTGGWTPDSRKCWFPTSFLTNQGFLQVKVTVDGVDSNVFSIVIAAPPSQPPKIIKIEPNQFPVKAGADSQSLYITASNIDGWGFTGASIDGTSAFIGQLVLQPGNDNWGTITIQMPKEYFTKAGTHKVQVSNRVGKSNIVNVTVGSSFRKATTNFDIKKVVPKTGVEKVQPPPDGQ